MKKKANIQESPFSNTYGGLSLVIGDDGHRYLEMEDCCGPEYFGPLTDEQASAFHTLCEVKEVRPAQGRRAETFLH
jgi:hypothetical protein